MVEGRKRIMRTGYHIHSEFSDDSKELMETQIERAIELGLDEICFTDHVDYGIKKDWDEGNIEWIVTNEKGFDPNSRNPLANVNYPEYFSKLSRMQETYKGKIRIKKGLEFGIQSSTVSKFESLFERYENELDFVLLSMHQVDNLTLWDQSYQSGKSQQEYNEGYYNEILKVIRTFKNYSVLAHLDLIARYDDNGVYPFEKVRDIITEILKTAIADGKGIEINTSSWHYELNDTQPSRKILKLYKELGGRIIAIGSDAHYDRYLGDHIDEAMKILKEIGFEEFCTFERMKPVFHRL